MSRSAVQLPAEDLNPWRRVRASKPDLLERSKKMTAVEMQGKAKHGILTITEVAASKAKEFMQKEGGSPQGLRVKAGKDECGCLTYGLETENVAGKDDVVIEERGLKIYIDPESAGYLQHYDLSIIDYVKTPKGEGFRINTPSSCGPECTCE